MVVKTKEIKITDHAMKRLKERVGSYDGYNSWDHLVKTARYYGKNHIEMTKEQFEYVIHHFDRSKFTNSMAIRYFSGFFYVFRGNNHHARTLVTVIKYDKNTKSVNLW